MAQQVLAALKWGLIANLSSSKAFCYFSVRFSGFSSGPVRSLYKGWNIWEYPGIQILQNPVTPENSRTCRRVLGVGILRITSFLDWSNNLVPFSKQTPGTLPPPCRSVPSSLTPGNLFPSAVGGLCSSLPSIFPWSQQPVAGHPRIVGAYIHTLPNGMSPDQKPRLPQRWLGSS